MANDASFQLFPHTKDVNKLSRTVFLSTALLIIKYFLSNTSVIDKAAYNKATSLQR